MVYHYVVYVDSVPWVTYEILRLTDPVPTIDSMCHFTHIVVILRRDE